MTVTPLVLCRVLPREALLQLSVDHQSPCLINEFYCITITITNYEDTDVHNARSVCVCDCVCLHACVYVCVFNMCGCICVCVLGEEMAGLVGMNNVCMQCVRCSAVQHFFCAPNLRLRKVGTDCFLLVLRARKSIIPIGKWR